MRKLLLTIFLVIAFAIPVSATEYTAPTAPEDAQQFMPQESVSFGKDVLTILSRAIGTLQPHWAEAVRICATATVAAILCSVVRTFPGSCEKTVELAGVLSVAIVMVGNAGNMVHLGENVIAQLNDYGKLLLPVMTAALASQGAVVTSGALYTGTAIFITLLNTVLTKLLVPIVYLYLAAGIGAAAIGHEMLKKLRDFLKWLTTWCLKTLLYVFTGYIGLTGVVSGSVDAATLKATKLTMSGMIPVVGGILSDASEALIVGAGVVKNAAGTYGMLAVFAILISPVLQIGIQYFLLKLTGIFCEAFGTKGVCDVIQCFSTAMGLLLGMASAAGILVMISTICFMKGAM